MRKRGHSDPGADRSGGRRRNGEDGEDESVEELPPRFDENGRRIDGGGGAGGGEMVERLAHDFGDVIDGRKSWRELLSGFGELGGGSGSGSGGRR